MRVFRRNYERNLKLHNQLSAARKESDELRKKLDVRDDKIADLEAIIARLEADKVRLETKQK